MNISNHNNFKEIEKVLKYSFKNKELIKIALTHSSLCSYPNNYERLEFLGDSILNFIVVEWLIKKFPEKDEGYLTMHKNYLVSSKKISIISNKLNLVKYLKFSESLDIKNVNVKKRISCDLFESLTGAIYLDSNYVNTKSFINRTLLKNYNKNQIKNYNYKGILNEYCQKKELNKPVYSIKNICGYDHEKIYKVELCINNNIFFGTGSKLKEAEDNAANKALLIVNKNK